MRKHRLIWLLGLTVVLGSAWPIAQACGPFFTYAVFVYRQRPDFPRTEFIDGKLGVLQPTWARSYLVIAYRYLSGVRMSPAERDQALDYFKDRGQSGPDRLGTDWQNEWLKARFRIPGAKPLETGLVTDGQMAYDPETHAFVLNCADDAYRTARTTLELRISQFGADSREVRDWLTAQDIVFSNCGGRTGNIPAAASPAMPKLIHSDRDYQIAAAYFYSGQYSQALKAFREIAAQESPWQTISRYLVARTLFRMEDDEVLAEEIDFILSDVNFRPIHGMTLHLQNRASLRTNDAEYFGRLAHLLTSRGQGNGLREELWDYTTMYERMVSQPIPPADDLTTWIAAIQNGSSTAMEHWKDTKSLPWLVAAMMTASPGAPPELLQAAAAIPPTSPAFETLAYHRYRIALQSGDRAGVRDGIREVLAAGKVSGSSENLFRSLAMFAAPTLAEFLQMAIRRPIAESSTASGSQWPDHPAASYGDRLDRDSTAVLNKELPFQMLRQVILDRSWPPHLRRELLLTGFTRGLMLGEDVGDFAEQLIPPAEAYTQATTLEAKRFAGAFYLLQHPEARPYVAAGIPRQTRAGRLDDFRDNWWCPMDVPGVLDSAANLSSINFSTPVPTIGPPVFLNAAQKEAARSEFQRLGELGNGPDFLWRMVQPFAVEHPNDPRVPEALHRIVRAARLSCAGTNTWRTARDAFRLLHQRYPGSIWAVRTPIWHAAGSSAARDAIK